jgi:hypothetical protein
MDAGGISEEVAMEIGWQECEPARQEKALQQNPGYETAPMFEKSIGAAQAGSAGPRLGRRKIQARQFHARIIKSQFWLRKLVNRRKADQNYAKITMA